MSIRFQCNECGRSLRVADEKAGKQVRCPGCKTAVRVPLEEPTATAAASPLPAVAPPPVAPPSPLEEPVAPYHALPGYEAAAVESAQPNAAEFVSISRMALYAQGVLLAVVALIAFCLGYAVGGRGTAPAATAQATPTGPFRIDGTLTYPEGGAQRGDAGAVIVVLPQGPFPDERIPIEGLRPNDSTDGGESIGVRAIESLGGMYRRANNEGQFELTLTQGGKYYMLLLSKNARRADDEKIVPGHLSVMASYFQNAAELLADRRYAWDNIEVIDNSQIDHAFAPRR